MTRGTKPVDVALYALLVMMLLSALFTDGAGPIQARHGRRCPPGLGD